VKTRTYLLGAVVVLVVIAHNTPTQTATSAASVGGELKPGTVPAAYAALVTSAGATCPQITPGLLAAQINQESGFNPGAVSPTGAEGIAQFEPGTAASNHVDPWDPDSAIHGMARLDCANVRRFGTVTLALAAYNGGPGIVGYWQDVDQTRHYVAAILAATPHYSAILATNPAPAPTPSPTSGTSVSTVEGVLAQLLDALRSAAAGSGSGK
jgi:soluble lytic murein transglycosylase-like protein